MEHPLTPSELDTVMDITFLFNSVLDLKMLSGRFLQLLGKIVPYEKAVIFLNHNGRQRLIPIAEIRCEKGLIGDYLETCHAMDYLGWLFYQSGLGVVRESERISVEEREKSSFNQTFLKKYEIAYRLLFNLETAKGELLGAAMFFRSRAFEEFTDHEVSVIELLRQHFSAAVQNALRFEQLKRSGALAQKVYHDITEAMFVLTSDLEIRQENQQTLRFLESLRQEPEEYQAFFETVGQACRSLQSEAPGEEVLTRSVTVKAYHGIAKISLIPTDTVLPQGPYEFVVVYSDVGGSLPPVAKQPQTEAEQHPDKHRKQFLAVLGTSYSLTRREVNLIELALDGLENREIAEYLHISLFTVKSHFQNSYAKLGVKSRQELFFLYMNYNISGEFRREFDAGARKDEFW